MGFPRFLRMVNREVSRWEGRQVWRRIVQAVFTALTDPAGVTVQRIGALERAGFVLADWRATKRRLADVEARMVEVLDELELTDLVTTIPGLSAVGAAAILAETGDLTRFDSPREVPPLSRSAGYLSGWCSSRWYRSSYSLGESPPSPRWMRCGLYHP